MCRGAERSNRARCQRCDGEGWPEPERMQSNQSPEPTIRGHLQFRYRGSRHRLAVVQLWSLERLRAR